VSACPVIVGEIAGQDAAQVAFAQDEDVIQTFAPDRANEPFREGVQPRALGPGQHVPDSHALHSAPKRVTVDAVPIAEEVRWRGVVRERLHNLLGGPVRGGMLGDVEVDETSSIVGEHDQDEEYPQARGGHREEIDGDQVPDVVGEERPPWDGGVRRFGSSRETVRSATSTPSFMSSPWIRGAPPRDSSRPIV
jgi:hypothetical protein